MQRHSGAPIGVSGHGPFVHVYDACMTYFKPMLQELASSQTGGGRKKSAPRRAPLPNAGRVDWKSDSSEHSGTPESRKNTSKATMPGVSRA